MTDTVLVTGGAGLVGSECCRIFAKNGYDVISVDNYTRGGLFGEEGDTETNTEYLTCKKIDHREMDIRDDEITDLVADVDAVIHTPAQPSHPKSIEDSCQTERNNSVRITTSRRCHVEYVISDGLRRDASAPC